MKSKGFTITEVVIVMVIFSVFVFGMIYLLNTYMNKVDKNIKLLDTINRMTQAGELVTQYLIKATGNATSIRISESGTEIAFDIVLEGNKIAANLTVINSRLIRYTEENQTIDLSIDDVFIKFDMPSGRPPIEVKISSPDPINKGATLTIEYELYPPGIR